MSHWTQDLKAENAALRAALDTALAALLDIPRSRMQKEADFPSQTAESGQAYLTCAREVYDRAAAARSAILEELAEKGI